MGKKAKKTEVRAPTPVTPKKVKQKFISKQKKAT